MQHLQHGDDDVFKREAANYEPDMKGDTRSHPLSRNQMSGST
jgi:hypothetical protein